MHPTPTAGPNPARDTAAFSRAAASRKAPLFLKSPMRKSWEFARAKRGSIQPNREPPVLLSCRPILREPDQQSHDAKAPGSSFWELEVQPPQQSETQQAVEN
jgi:hypothetical protein